MYFPAIRIQVERGGGEGEGLKQIPPFHLILANGNRTAVFAVVTIFLSPLR